MVRVWRARPKVPVLGGVQLPPNSMTVQVNYEKTLWQMNYEKTLWLTLHSQYKYVA